MIFPNKKKNKIVASIEEDEFSTKFEMELYLFVILCTSDIPSRICTLTVEPHTI